MKIPELQKTLEKIGLNEHEAKTYLSSLSLGGTTVLKLSKDTGLPRTTIYSIIESLKRKGLMHIEERGFKKLYAPQKPEQLEIMLDERRQEFKNLLPEFSALYNLTGEESLIHYYEGMEAVKTVYNTLIKEVKNGNDYLVVADQETWYKQDPKFFQSFMERRAKLPINIRMLLQDSHLSREHKKFQKNWNLNIRILPKGTSLNTDLVITPQNVMIQQLEPPIMAILIKNKSIIKMHQELFEIIWKATQD